MAGGIKMYDSLGSPWTILTSSVTRFPLGSRVTKVPIGECKNRTVRAVWMALLVDKDLVTRQSIANESTLRSSGGVTLLITFPRNRLGLWNGQLAMLKGLSGEVQYYIIP